MASEMARVALVTGGTRGIGAAVARALQKEGHTVGVTYVGNEERARGFTKETGIQAWKWDVSDYDACQRGVAQVEKELGSVDVLVNNAGITRDGAFHKMSVEAWRAVLSANLDSVFHMSSLVFVGMRERGWGRIISMSSINGQKGQFGQVNYATSKAGIIGFSKALALEGAAKGVTVNVVAPGYIDTDMVAAVPEKVRDAIRSGIPVGRFGLAEEIAAATCFLASDNASFITGETMAINGGQYMD